MSLNFRFLALQSLEIRSTFRLHSLMAASSSSVTSKPGSCFESTKQMMLFGLRGGKGTLFAVKVPALGIERGLSFSTLKRVGLLRLSMLLASDWTSVTSRVALVLRGTTGREIESMVCGWYSGEGTNFVSYKYHHSILPRLWDSQLRPGCAHEDLVDVTFLHRWCQGLMSALSHTRSIGSAVTTRIIEGGASRKFAAMLNFPLALELPGLC